MLRKRNDKHLLVSGLFSFIAACGGGSISDPDGGGPGSGSEGPGSSSPRPTPSPTLALPQRDGNLPPDTSVSLDFSDNFSGLQGTRTYTGVNIPQGLELDSARGILSGVVAQENTTPLQVTISVVDGLSTTLTDSFEVSFLPNAPPVLAASPSNVTLRRDTRPSVSLSLRDVFTENDLTDQIELNLAEDTLPQGLRFESAALLGRVREAAMPGPYVITLTASDGVASVETSFTLVLNETNTPPQPVEGIRNTVATLREEFSLNLPSLFHDPDYREELTYAVSSLPVGLTLNDEGEIITGSITQADLAGETYSFTITATDLDETSSEFVYTLILLEEGEKTTLNQTETLGDRTLDEAAEFSLDFSEFFDNPGRRELTFSLSVSRDGTAHVLPLDLALDGDTLEGIVTEDDQLGSYTLTLEVTDGVTKLEESFVLLVENTNDAPVLTTAALSDVRFIETERLPLNFRNIASWFTDADDTVLTYEARWLQSGMKGPLPDWLRLDEETGGLFLERLTDDQDVGVYTLIFSGLDDEKPVPGRFDHSLTLTLDNFPEPFTTAPFPNLIAPKTTMTEILTLDLSAYFGHDTPGTTLTFEASSEHPSGDTEDLVNVEVEGNELLVTLVHERPLGAFETIIVTAMDAQGSSVTAEFLAVSPKNTLEATGSIEPLGLQISNERAGSHFGTTGGGAGDVNGDGIPDLFFGAPEGEPNGQVYVLFGTTTGTTVSFDAQHLGANGGFVVGSPATVTLGGPFGAVGDINGDGFPEFLLAAPEASPNGTVYMLYGGDELLAETIGETVTVLDDYTTAAERATLSGGGTLSVGTTLAENASFQHGVSVSDSGLELLNSTGDPIADLVTYPFLRTDALPEGAGIGLTGTEMHDLTDVVTLAGGDFDGDGRNDILFGAPGTVYVVYNEAVPDGAAASVSIDASIGLTVSALSGTPFSSVGPAGDVNGDGIDDILIGVETASTLYVLYGRTREAGATPSSLDLASLAPADAPADGFLLRDTTTGAELGGAIAAAGDVNGDGYDDILALDGAMEQVYLFYGRAEADWQSSDLASPPPDDMPDEMLMDDMLPFPSEFLTIQLGSGDFSGAKVASAGDINGDGLHDFLISLPGRDKASTQDAGAVYVLYGSSEPPAENTLALAMLSAQQGFLFEGQTAGGQLGVFASAAGDVNGDGYDDILTGAPGETAMGDTDAGAGYILYGMSTLGSVVAHDQVLRGSVGVSLLRGGSGDDTLEAHADTEVLYGGAGDDIIALADLDFRRIDGGSGQDTLRLGSGLSLDLTENTGRVVQNIELFHLEASSSQLRLDLFVFHALGERDSSGDYAIRVTGQGSVVLVDPEGGASWDYTDTPPEADDVYRFGDAVLYVEDGVSVS